MKEEEKQILRETGNAIKEWFQDGLSKNGTLDDDFDNHFFPNRQQLFDLLEKLEATEFMEKNRHHIDNSIKIVDSKENATTRKKAQYALVSILEMVQRSELPISLQMCLGAPIAAYFLKQL